MFRHEKIDTGYEDLVVSNSPMGRFYSSPTGNRYPSITTVLGELSRDSISDWRARVGPEEADKISGRASRRGTAVHDILEKYVNNEVIPDNTLPHIKHSYLKLKPILDKNLTEVYGQEVALYSDMIELAGRVDCVGMWNGVPSVIDYKTSRKPKKKEWCDGMFMQTCFYAIAWEERTGMAVPNLVIVMDVDDNDPIVFVEHRDNWVTKLNEAKEFYYKRQRQRVV